MTREEAIKHIQVLMLLLLDNDNQPISDLYFALDMAIKALEQEPVLDKIRAEILFLDDVDYDFEGYYKAITDALKIIDKYRGESEDKE